MKWPRITRIIKSRIKKGLLFEIKKLFDAFGTFDLCFDRIILKSSCSFYPMQNLCMQINASKINTPINVPVALKSCMAGSERRLSIWYALDFTMPLYCETPLWKSSSLCFLWKNNCGKYNSLNFRTERDQWSSSVLAILFLLLLARSFSGNELFSSRSLGKNFRAQSSELLSE